MYSIHAGVFRHIACIWMHCAPICLFVQAQVRGTYHVLSWHIMKNVRFFQPIFLPESKLETGSSPQTSKTFTFRSLRMQVKTRKLIPDSEMLFQVPRANVRIFLRHPEAPLSSPHSGGPSKHRTGQVLQVCP